MKRRLAALNHPHVAAIYGLEEQGPIRGLVLEERGQEGTSPVTLVQNWPRMLEQSAPSR